MIRIIFTFILFFTFFQFSFSQIMKVHTSSGIDEYNISEIDSITFTINDSTNLNVGLMAYYPFNGNANDESGNGNHGIVYGAQLTSDRFGNPNNAYFFDGVDDYIDIGNNPTLKPQLPVSFSFWINYTIYSTKIPIFTNNYDTTNTYSGIFSEVDPWSKIAISFGDGGTIGPSSRRTKRSSTITQGGIWLHVVGIIRDSQDMDIYLNGVNDGGTYDGSGGVLAYSMSPANIGRMDYAASGPPYYFKGIIDELRIYNRVLSGAEIQALYRLY